MNAQEILKLRGEAIAHLDQAVALLSKAVYDTLGDTPEAYAAHRQIASNAAVKYAEIDQKYPPCRFAVGDKVRRIDFTCPIHGYQPVEAGLTVFDVRFIANHWRVKASRTFLDDDLSLPLRDGYHDAGQHMFVKEI